MTYINHIASFVKYNRNKNRMTQEDLAAKAGVGLRFIRDLEQGKETLRMDKVNQVLALFGYRAVPGSQKIKDPYDIFINHFNIKVHIYLKNKIILAGVIIGSVSEENEIKAWKFVSNNNAVEFQKTKNENLIQVIQHSDIENVENI
ncbi:helix-turn-helix transcriptional regulator [Niastella populi]|uniref:HTH cro/C1-type domain-containing protein n=1 Tax=Niastella populi TaxID=550983 RepID=A0A1V9EJ34_9BACT|nr:helix-turn-helix transcriptional regulator [Niastella populi]OQP46168.1 hypothetical protein A4R26_32170 [Niastella populi]